MTPTDLIYLMLMLLVSLAAVMAWLHHRRWLQQRHEDGLRWCGTLLELVLRLQQHRGMASALLAGDPGFRSSLAAKRREVDALFQSLLALPPDADSSIHQVAAQELPALHQRWLQLCADLDGLTPFVSMTRHTAVIGTLLTWLRGIGEACINTRSMAGEARLDFVVPVFVERLPVLSETLGQIRALGAAAAAAGKVGAAERVKLSYLVHRITELLGRSETALDHAGVLRNPEAARGFGDVRDKVQTLLDMVCRELLEPSDIRLAPMRYFAVATQAIDAVFALVHLLQQKLNGSEPRGSSPAVRPAAAETAHPALGKPLVH